jgi:tetratricopeptide (TPR) repeat protein
MTDRITGDTNTKTSSFNWQHAVVLVLGVAVIVLLLFADKTHLKGEDKALTPVAENPQETAPPPAQAAALPPPFTGSRETERRMNKASDPATPVDSVMAAVEALVVEGRPDLAASFADILVQRDSSSRNLLVLGAINRNALKMDWVMENETSFSGFATKAVSILTRAEALDPKNEDIKIELGLALVQSRVQENSMKGIFKLREVVEMNPRNAEAAFQLGQLSMDTGQFDKAEGRFRTVLEINPAYHPARYSLAICLEQLGRVEEAKTEMKAIAGQQEYLDLAQAASQWISKH